MTAPRRITSDTAEQVLYGRLDGQPLILLLDVDGTLAPIAPAPDRAEVPPETQEVLRRLIVRDDVVVALVSGRAARDAARLAGVSGVWVIGNHGFERQEPDGDATPVEAVVPFGDAIANAARELALLEPRIPGTFVENKRWTLSVHYRQVDPSSEGAVIQESRAVAGRLGLRVSEGKKVVELRPPVEVNKGTASVALADRLGGFGAGASVAYVGDDRTDEDAFRALRRRSSRVVTVRVLPTGASAVESEPETEAEFVVASTDELRSILAWLAARRAEGATR